MLGLQEQHLLHVQEENRRQRSRSLQTSIPVSATFRLIHGNISGFVQSEIIFLYSLCCEKVYKICFPSEEKLVRNLSWMLSVLFQSKWWSAFVCRLSVVFLKALCSCLCLIFVRLSIIRHAVVFVFQVFTSCDLDCHWQAECSVCNVSRLLFAWMLWSIVSWSFCLNSCMLVNCDTTFGPLDEHLFCCAVEFGYFDALESGKADFCLSRRFLFCYFPSSIIWNVSTCAPIFCVNLISI